MTGGYEDENGGRAITSSARVEVRVDEDMEEVEESERDDRAEVDREVSG
jgi:hypothetical protein